jgi:hypothetical protein
VLNACYSTAQAEALGAKIDCVVGMDGAIGDDAARAFAIRFYGALGSGRSIANAVAQGVATLAAKLTPSDDDDARIDACTDLATLERWLDRAITEACVSDVLG